MTATTDKPRIDAWDAALTEAQRWQAFERMRAYPWHEVVAWIGEEFGVEPPSRSALYRWSARMRQHEAAHRIETALAERDALRAEMGQTGDLSQELRFAFERMAFDGALNRDPAQARHWWKLAQAMHREAYDRAELELKARVQQTRDEALALAREKFEAAEARLNAAREAIEQGQTGTLDPAAVMARVDAILGRKSA